MDKYWVFGLSSHFIWQLDCGFVTDLNIRSYAQLLVVCLKSVSFKGCNILAEFNMNTFYLQAFAISFSLNKWAESLKVPVWLVSVWNDCCLKTAGSGLGVCLQRLLFLQVMGHRVRGMLTSVGRSRGVGALHSLWQQKDCQRRLRRVSHVNTPFCSQTFVLGLFCDILMCRAAKLRYGTCRQPWTHEPQPAHYVCAL